MDLLNVFIGMTFSGGVIDYALFGLLPAGAGVPTNWYWVLVVGAVYAVLYYFVFYFLITKLNLKTPGREDDDIDGEMDIKLENNDFTAVAETILKGLGGKENVVSIDNCVTRLRLEIKDNTKVNEKVIKSAGVAGIIRPGKTNIQVIVGTQVQFVADELKKLCK